MSKILLVGYNPPQFEKNAKIEAAHYRTWQFLQPLLDDGHEILLCARVSPANQNYQPVIPPAWQAQLRYHPIALNQTSGWVGQLQNLHDAFDPDGIVAVNFDCCLSVTKLTTDRPIWMDIYGDYLTIMQVARYRAGSDRGIQTSIEFMRRVLKKGDAFSVCGTPQAHMLVGELAMAGRLNSTSFSYEFTNVVLPGAPPNENEENLEATTTSYLSDRSIPDDAFVVLWCGGYNAWTDVQTLYKGLEWAMQHRPEIHYVSVGANTYGGTQNVYEQLLGMIAKSPYRERFHMLGWRPWAEVAGYYRESNVGFNIDGLHYETIFGTRTRLVEMLGAGLPVITSLGCELSDLIGKYGAGLTFESGDWQGMGEQILALANDKMLYERMVETATDYAANTLSFANTTASVRAWVKEPTLAPDHSANISHPWSERLEFKMRSIVRQLVWQIRGYE